MNEIYQSGLSGDRVMELLRRQFVVPTLSSAPTTNTLRWVDDMGYTNTFRVGELCRVAIDDGYTFYILKDLKNGVATWELMGSGGGEGDTELTPVYNLIKTKLDNSYFRRIFSPLDANGNEIAPNDVNTPISSIRVNYGLWSESFLSAKGRNSEGTSSGGGASALYQLNDVAKNSSADGVLGAAKGSLLSYDGTHWYAIPQSSVMPNLSGYATQLWVEGKDYSTKSELNTAISALNTELGGKIDLKLDAVTFNELFEKVQLEDGTWAIKAKLGLFSDGFISAKGSNVGGTTSEGGAVALYQLNDVLSDGTQVSGAQNGAVFVYDATIGKWKGVAQSEIVPNLTGYAKESWVLQQGFLTGITSALVTGALGYIPYDSANFTKAKIKSTLGISDWALASSKPSYTTKEVSEDTNLYFTNARAVAALKSITDGLSGNISTLQGYFTGGVANSALRLSDNGSYTAWGQTFFTNGKPKSVSGALTDVTTITTSGAATIGGTLSNQVSHLIYDSEKANRLSMAWVNGLSCIYSLKVDNSGYNDLRLGVTGNTSSQLYFDASEGKWGIGTSTPEYKLDVNGEARVTKLVIGDGTIEWDANNNGFKVTGGLYSTSYISAKGANTNGGSSSGEGLITSLYRYADLGKTFSDTNNDTFNAYTINKINADLGSRISVLEGKATNVSFTQSLTSGTQIGTITIDGASKNIYAPTIPTSDINKGVTAHGWGNHASVGYLTSASSLAWGKITGKPTTISGYGITDAYTISQVDSALGGYLPKSGGTLTSNNVALTIKRFTSNPIIGFNGGAEDANERYGYLGFSGKDRPAYIDATGSAVYPIIHSGNIGSQSVASASDADKLDGKHLTDIINYIENPTTAIDLNSYTANEGINVISYNNASLANVANSPFSYGTGVLSFGSRYPMQFATPHTSNKLVFRSYYNGWYDWREVAFIDSNVASATKLQTARSIWGQSFDGTADVSGAMSGITTINVSGAATFGSTLTTANNIRVKATTATARQMYVENSVASISIYTAKSGNRGLFDATNSKWLLYTDSSKIFIQSYPVEIANDVVCNATLYAKTGIWSDGYVSAKGQNTSSDMRLKNVLSEVVLGVKDIANAPSVRFSWKNGGGVDVGSSAQYWQGLLPDAVKERDGMLEMQYANIALLSAIALAKNFETMDERVARLERENEELRNEIKCLRYGK